MTDNWMGFHVVLASASPRRKELLAQLGIEADIRPSHVEEESWEKKPDQIVMELSRQKAEDVAAGCCEGTMVIGADTVVALGNEVLGKPGTPMRAYEMIEMLQGRSHQVFTGVTVLLCLGRGKCHGITFAERTDVHVYPMTAEEIAAYAACGEPLDKAGAYGIQGRFAAYIQGIAGDYSNVVGLPLGRLCQEVKDFWRTGKMIKLIVSDVDGTLVEDGSPELNPEIFKAILKLREKGLQVVIASGRPWASVQKAFEPVKEKIFYVSNNGAYVGCYGRCLYAYSIEPSMVKRLIERVRLYPELEIVYAGVNGDYVETENEALCRWLVDSYKFNLIRVKDLLAVEEPCVKISVYKPQGIEAAARDIYEEFNTELKVACAGDMWMDCMAKGVNKGHAVKMIQESLGITPQETMAFGDQLNDLEMLDRAYYSFAVANARDEVRKAARFQADSNVNNGVLKILKQLL